MNRLPLVKYDDLREIIAKSEYIDAATSLRLRLREFAGPGEAIVMLKSLANIATEAADQLVEEIITNNATGTHLGAKVEIAKLPSKWDYSGCNDPVLGGLEKKLAEVKAEIKDRQGFLQRIPKSETADANGEIIVKAEALVEFINDKGENDSAVVNRAKQTEAGQTVKVTLPK